MEIDLVKLDSLVMKQAVRDVASKTRIYRIRHSLILYQMTSKFYALEII